MGMPNTACVVWLTAIGCAIAAGAGAGQSSEATQLARFREKVRQDMTGIPNYTCLETVDRAHRDPHHRSFKAIDTVRLEVSSVGGKELVAWPGARRFGDQDATTMVTGGAIGTGMFALFAQKLFVTGAGTLQYGGAENLAGRASVRYDFHVTRQDSGFRITASGASEAVAAKGSFWFDTNSLDLIRLDVYGDAMPYSLRLEEAVFRTSYSRTRIGEADALLPRQSELTMTHFSGEASRNAIKFSNCHEYQSQSTISFAAPPASVPETPKAQVREVNLPAGVLVPVELDMAIDSKTASVGDTLRGHVAAEVRYQNDLLLPQGAAIAGHIRQLSRRSSRAPAVVGLEFSEVEWPGAHAAFYAELVDLYANSAGSHHPVTYFNGHAMQVLIEGGLPGVGVFYLDAAGFHIPSGFHMVWRTLAGSGRIVE